MSAAPTTVDDLCARFDDDRLDAGAVGHARSFIRHLVVERGLSVNTARAYATDLRDYLSWAARAGVDPIEVGYRRFRRYLAELDAAGYTRRTAARRVSAIRTFFAYLNARGVTANNPAAASATPKARHPLPRKTAADALDRLLSVCDVSDAAGQRDQAFLELLYASGARISEVAGLKVADVDLSARQVTLFGKGSKQRVVPLHQTAAAAVRSYVEGGRVSLLTSGPQEALFVSRRGRPMSADSLRRVFKRRAAQAGLDPSLHPHDIRHAFATDLVEGGADLRSVQELLGHASLSTTQVYTHLSLKHMRDTMRQAHPRS